MKKFIKKLCALAALSMAPLALNNFNKPTFAMESSDLYNDFNEIKQNYEAELKTMNEEIQTTITRFENEINSTNKTLNNKSNNSSNNRLNVYFTYLENLKQACFKKARLMNSTIDDALSTIVALPSVEALFGTMITDVVKTINTLEKYYKICGCHKPKIQTNTIFKCLYHLIGKIQTLLAKDPSDCLNYSVSLQKQVG